MVPRSSSRGTTSTSRSRGTRRDPSVAFATLAQPEKRQESDDDDDDADDVDDAVHERFLPSHQRCFNSRAGRGPRRQLFILPLGSLGVGALAHPCGHLVLRSTLRYSRDLGPPDRTIYRRMALVASGRAQSGDLGEMPRMRSLPTTAIAANAPSSLT
jgi:hypothetical protein